MANRKTHPVMRADKLTGTYAPTNLVSARFYDDKGELAEVENGTIVVIGEGIEGERELIKVTAVKEDTPATARVGVVYTPEVIYDEVGHVGLEHFTNEAGTEIRVYILEPNDVFSIGYVAADFTGKYTKDKKTNCGNVTICTPKTEVAGNKTYIVNEVIARVAEQQA